ncbi:hypothetical protein JW890_01755 [candidate division WOR-3 bacterium]|nr:hypothetical protein [candidate division WOR-3 bacterium]
MNAIFFSCLFASVWIPEGATLTGLSVFKGTRIDTFELSYITTVSSGRISGNMIIAKCEGEFFEKTGVLYGMSGSPVYYEGVLIGALSAAWSDSREPIAGITPIEEMMEDVKYGLSGFIESGRLRKYEVCISVSGLSFAAAELLGDHLPDNFTLSEGSGEKDIETQISPGSVLSVVLAGGDATVAATGTVTLVKGDTVIGFGHPFLGEGACEYPMAGGFVNTVMPLSTLGFKMASPTNLAGTITSDVSTAVSGIIGPVPEVIPVKVIVCSEDIEKKFEFWVCRSSLFTPVLVPVLSLSALQTSSLYSYGGFFSVRTELHLPAGRKLSLSNSFNGINSLSDSWTYGILSVLNIIATNSFRRVYPDSVSVIIASSREPNKASIKNMMLSASKISPGETLSVTLSFELGDSRVRVVNTDIAFEGINFPDTLGIIACDALNLSLFFSMENPLWSDYRGFDELLDALEKQPSNNKVYIVLYEKEAELALGADVLSRTPVSVMSILKYGNINAVPNFTALKVLAIREIEMNSVVSGAIVNRIIVEER